MELGLTSPSKAAASHRLNQAVRRNRAFSREGLLEIMFTWAFKGLVYPQIWEDPEVDMEALALTPQCHVVAIASGGCNVLSYLIADPGRITAVDLSRAHIFGDSIFWPVFKDLSFEWSPSVLDNQRPIPRGTIYLICGLDRPFFPFEHVCADELPTFSSMQLADEFSWAARRYQIYERRE